jgi:hypothetical protein
MTDPERHLLDLYAQWRRLSLAEGEAIRAANWATVEKCQADKASLQTRITAAGKSCSTKRQRPGSSEPEAERELRGLVRELLALERENEAALQAQQRRTHQQQAEFTQTSRALRRVHAAYAPGGRAGWHSYS